MTTRPTTKRPDCLVFEGVSDDCYWCAWVWALCWTVPRWPHAVLIGAVVLLTGCAEVWDKPGASDREFDRDVYECENGIMPRQVAMPYAPSASPDPYVNTQMAGQALMNSAGTWGELARTERLFAMCMRARGWTRQ